MIDPVSIGLAFTAAQSIVSNVKSALNTGKDVYSILGDVGKFFNINSDIHKANIDLKLGLLNKSNEELQAQALETAMMAHQMVEYKRQLKDLLYWSGNAVIWDDMEREHTRLIKEKREMERKRDEAKRKHKQEMTELIFGGLISFMLIGITGFFVYIAFTVYVK
jgi:preprotein translocase subunit Sss1